METHAAAAAPSVSLAGLGLLDHGGALQLSLHVSNSANRLVVKILHCVRPCRQVEQSTHARGVECKMRTLTTGDVVPGEKPRHNYGIS